MENGRIWQRGASKGRKGSTNKRLMQQEDEDCMDRALQKSLIAETLQGARAMKASLHEPSRPFTPGDMPRHLLYGNDYSNRPGSSYKMNNVIGQAADEFASMGGTAVKTQASDNQSEDVLSIMERHVPVARGGFKMSQSNSKTKLNLRPVLPGHQLPSIDPSVFTRRGKKEVQMSPETPKEAIGSGLNKQKQPEVSMKDF